MKICFVGLDLPEGKVKYQDTRVIQLDKKFEPKKVTPFYAEFIKDDCQQCDGFIVSRDHVWDLFILDMEKLETRRDRASDEAEKQLLSRCLEYVEQEIPLCDVDFSEEELALLKQLAPLTFKPTVIAEASPEINNAIEQVLQKAGIIFFYTADKKEVHAWPVKKDSDIVTCAGKIHSDLARGFIKAEIVRYEDLIQVYNWQEARTKGLVQLVDRDYTIQAGDIIEIRFNI
jgi:ribosome-binding ATPase YchF (GTP1/OBG family)